MNDTNDRYMTDENSTRRPTNRDRPKKTMADVSHTPPYEAPDANRVFERGGELLTDERRP
ncbi:hypothetical protein BG842_08805 [Haladaptatus sp. W1]|uniref:hypothetical protein n=1 Tax=Haladaptatus sp. W1 TaxID=1897478 RepID=UPI000849DA21|nr:hypothetical protein [Haladaptatus sp. W1]ODR81570.1 hypothetical protein BG842_08805 [Haladaptatus sp. W1]